MNIIYCSLPLNLNFVEILLHLVNLAILVVAVRFLLYKPIKKFMQKRAEEFRKHDDECDEMIRKAEQSKLEYEELIAQSKQDALQITKTATEAAELRSGEIIAAAKDKADQILAKADEESRRKMQDQASLLKLSISDLAYSMATQILQREIVPSDLDSELESIIGEWDNA